MLKEERYDNILKMLEESNYISAKELSERLYVSMPTIRRDLAVLDRKKLIIRSHGGAKKIGSDHSVMPLDFRKSKLSNEKRLICKAAARFIEDNDIIFIDASTTAMQMADFLSDKKGITVITNSAHLSVILAKKGIENYCSGGMIIESSFAYAGSLAEEFVKKFNIDKMFFSSHGINERGIIIDTSLPETQLRKCVMNQSKQSFFLCDKTKISASAPYNLASVEEVDYTITDTEISFDFLPKNHNCKIIRVL